MNLTSSAFLHGDAMPARFAREQGNISPPLEFANVPPNARSLVIVMDDPDAPHGTFTHWLVWNLPPGTTMILENQLPAGAHLGRNDFGDVGYGGPRPPSGTHRYFFHAYALKQTLELPRGASRRELERMLEAHILETATLMGRFSAAQPKS